MATPKPNQPDRSNFHPGASSDQDASQPPSAAENATDKEGPTTSRTDPNPRKNEHNAQRDEADAMKDN